MKRYSKILLVVMLWAVMMLGCVCMARADETVKITISSTDTGKIVYTVKFKVVNGEWNLGGSEEKNVTLSRYENEDKVLVLTDNDIPAVGNRPADGFKEGAWDVQPSTNVAISESKTYTYTYVEKPKISATVNFKVVNGSWDDGTAEDKIVTLNGHEGDTLHLTAAQIPAVGGKPDEAFKAGSWDTVPTTSISFANGSDMTFTYTYAKKQPITATVTFKVVNGEWNEGGTGEKTVTLTGLEGQQLKLSADQIPAVGDKPNETFKPGNWDVIPSTDRTFANGSSTTYTYYYVPKDSISVAVTFKVVNGSWDDGDTADVTVSLFGREAETLKLKAEQIPAVGSKPNDSCKAGAWDVTPSTETVIREDATYTYSYAQKDATSAVVSFKVLNGFWDDGTVADKSVTLTGYEGDVLKLSADQIPAVGSNPADGFKVGAWDMIPTAGSVITTSTVFTYSYAKIEPEPVPIPKDKVEIALDADLKTDWNGSTITFSFGAVPGATSYDIYAAYCETGSLHFLETVTRCSAAISQLDGKKLNQNKAIKLAVIARCGDAELGESIVLHIAGPKNKYTSVKKIKISKKKYNLKNGNTVKLKPKLVLTNRKKKVLPKGHAPKFRYASSDKSVATVSKNGKVKAVGKGTCEIYIYAVNGMTQKVTVTVK